MLALSSAPPPSCWRPACPSMGGAQMETRCCQGRAPRLVCAAGLAARTSVEEPPEAVVLHWVPDHLPLVRVVEMVAFLHLWKPLAETALDWPLAFAQRMGWHHPDCLASASTLLLACRHSIFVSEARTEGQKHRDLQKEGLHLLLGISDSAGEPAARLLLCCRHHLQDWHHQGAAPTARRAWPSPATASQLATWWHLHQLKVRWHLCAAAVQLRQCLPPCWHSPDQRGPSSSARCPRL
mmetsp:Transcript_45627/g.108613  ORF Transcript_45627/g.108613 Transcript_45627/m.108613 type:complete len:238 (-) Transcript_45627:410-1123(-)